MSYIGETHLKMTTRARAFYLLKKSDKNDLGIRLLLDFLKSDSTALGSTPTVSLTVKDRFLWLPSDAYQMSAIEYEIN